MPVAFNIKGSTGIAMYGSRLTIVLFELGRIHMMYEDDLIILANSITKTNIHFYSRGLHRISSFIVEFSLGIEQICIYLFICITLP